ncbi:MAG: extracellular solute-binding protein [Clostridia bacterium]|nr:extracellular solute-binding protein [Clostridia bacterium]MBP5780779.1 extracellular solute-binding protein [Clostridia bacterium]
MKKVFKVFLLVILVIAAVFSCVSCRKQEIQYGIVEKGYSPEIKGTVKISAFNSAGEEGKTSIRAFASAFENKYPGTKVNVDISITDQNSTATRISSGDIGDVFFFWEEDTYSYAISNNALMNLTQYLEPLGIDIGNIYSGTMDLGRVNGNIYMVARDHTHTMLFYNRDALVSAGLSDPPKGWTWDDFKNYCERLTIVGDDGKYEQVGAKIDFSYGPGIIPVLQGWGGKWFDTINKHIDLTSENVVKGVGELIGLMEQGYLIPTGGTNEINAKYSNVINNRMRTIFTDSVFPELANRCKEYESYDVDWNVCDWFAYPVHSVGAGATGFGVYNRTKNPDTAAALALFFYTEDGQIAYNGQIGGSVPNVRSLALDEFWRVGGNENTNYDAFVSYPDCDVVGKFECLVPPEIASILKSQIPNVFSNHFSGRANYRDTLAKIEEQCNQKWKVIYGG